jgi:PPOX class probable F420-dependent enzyme
MALDDDVVRLAKGANLATIVTLMPSGQPQAQLRWIDTDGENLIVNTEPQRQAARNLERDPRVTVLIHSSDDPYDWAEVRGRVVDTQGGDKARAHIDALSRKYTGHDYEPPVGPQGRVMQWIAPQKVVTPAIRSRARQAARSTASTT